jgi:hypothetical protein
MYTRDYTGVTVLEPPQLVLVRLPGRPKCGECGGDAVTALRADSTGYSMGTDHLHARTCSSISCPHGNLHSEPCATCEAEEDAQQRIPLALEACVEALRELAYSDNLVDLLEEPLRQCLVDDVAGTGTALLSELEVVAFICGSNDGEVPTALALRFPKTHAWLEEQLA